MTTELTKAAQQALEQLEFLNACYPHKTAADAISALQSALTQRPAAQTEREADGYGSTDLPWSFTVCRELEPQEKRLMSMLVSAFGSEHPAIDDMAHLILNRPASPPAPQQATPASGNILTDAFNEVQALKQQATPEPVLLNGLTEAETNATASVMGLTATPEPLTSFDDPKVQVVYDLLCSDEAPPPEQHWEGWVARRIVDALAATPEPVGEPVYQIRLVDGAWMDLTKHVYEEKVNLGHLTVRVLYTHPAPGVPEPSINWFGTHFTYKNQPCDNVTCWRLGEAARSAKPGGDLIDHGLSLLHELEKHGYGVYSLAAAQAKGGEHD